VLPTLVRARLCFTGTPRSLLGRGGALCTFACHRLCRGTRRDFGRRNGTDRIRPICALRVLPTVITPGLSRAFALGTGLRRCLAAHLCNIVRGHPCCTLCFRGAAVLPTVGRIRRCLSLTLRSLFGSGLTLYRNAHERRHRTDKKQYRLFHIAYLIKSTPPPVKWQVMAKL